MTHVRTVTRYACTSTLANVHSVTLPAAPWEDGRPWTPPQKRPPPKRMQGEATPAVLRALTGCRDGVRTVDLANRIGMSASATGDALRRLLARGEVTRRRECRNGAYLWSLPDA